MDAQDLCHVEAVSKGFRRVATDNELWKELFLRTFGRLRGGRSQFTFTKRPLVSLPAHLHTTSVSSAVDWKSLYIIGNNWRRGRSVIRQLELAPKDGTPKPLVLFLGQQGLVLTSGDLSFSPSIAVSSSDTEMHLFSGGQIIVPIRISSLSLNQLGQSVGDAHSSILLAAFYSTDTKLHHLSIFEISTGIHSSREVHIMSPRTPRRPITCSAFHSNLLLSLSEGFQLDIYLTPTGKPSDMMLMRTLTSYSSFLPSSLTLSRPSTSLHRILLSYTVPLYPAHWSVACTQFQLDSRGETVDSKTLRVFPYGWKDILDDTEDDFPLQGGRFLNISAVQSDGKWMVVVPQAETFVELYRLRTNSISFVRVLSGPTAPICAVAIADGRVVAVALDGSIWIYDLERSWTIELRNKALGAELDATRICFDERRIAITTPSHVQVISFD